MQFGCVLPPFGPLWRDIGRLLDAAVQRGGNDWGEVVARLDDGRAQLWLATQRDEPVAAMVTKVDGDTLEVWLAGGAVLSGCIPYLETAISASLDAGTTNGRITGRKGWQRVLRPFGWRPRGEDLIKTWSNNAAEVA